MDEQIIGQVFSTILYVDQEELMELALKRFQRFEQFTQQVQLIVVDPHLSEAVKAACGGCPNVRYLPAEGVEIAEAYNLGLGEAKGKYIGFSRASGAYSPRFFRSAIDLFKNETVQMVSANPVFVDADGTQIPYAGAALPGDRHTVIDLTLSDNSLQLLLQAYLFRRSLLDGRSFDESLHEDALLRFLLEVQLDCPVYTLMKESVQYRYTVSMEDNTSTNPLQYHPWWYGDSVNSFIIPLLDGAKERFGRIPDFLQAACYYEIYHKFNCNLNDRNKGVLPDKGAVMAFAEDAFQALTRLDNRIIARQQITTQCKANRGLRMLFFRGRAQALGQAVHMVDGGSDRFTAVLETDGTDQDFANRVAVFGPLGKETLRITVMNEENGTLFVEAAPGMVDYLEPEEFKLFAVTQDADTGEENIYEAAPSTVYPLVKCFGITCQRKYPVQFRIPSTQVKRLDITFCYEFQGRRYPLGFTFGGGNSRLDPGDSRSYWMFRDHWLLRWRQGGKDGPAMLYIRKVRRKTHIQWERNLQKSIAQNLPDKKLARQIVRMRRLYWLLLPLYRKKHVWIAFDKIYKAGDNGEYMYQYLRANCPEIEPYYIIRRDSPDYERLVKQDKKHILVFGTLRCLLISLMAEVYLDTHANIPAQFNPTPDWKPYTKDLQRGEVVCIQHGLTIQKIAQFQNRLFDNIKLYCCASPYEVENLSRPFYDYTPDMLKLTGLARYDGLKSNDQKIILITPSWRKNVVNSSVANQKKTHNSNFKNSDYFRIYNRLINDETLIDCAKRTGYRIVYLLHPAMSAQLEDFDRNDYVELIPATGDVSYEKILTESSLMVTDYSGVQFDFAYMRKCLIYYHPDQLPPHYDEGGLIYSTMGFGPICTNHEQIVDELCRAMERGCATEQEYIRRADDFFAYDDHDNCRRIYEAIRTWQKERKGSRKA